MEAESAQSGGEEVLLQALCQSLRTTEPDFGKTRVPFVGQHPGSVQYLALPGAMYMQTNAGQSGAEGFEPGNKGIAGTVSCAVVQIGRNLPGTGRQRFEPGEKGGDADPACYPDLPSFRVDAADVEPTVGAFNLHHLAGFQVIREAARVIPQRLDLEAESSVTLICAGNRERMRPFLLVKGNECKLARVMSAPRMRPLSSKPTS